MSDFVLTEESAKTPIGDLLRDADEAFEVVDERGGLVARILPAAREPQGTFEMTDEERAELRRRLDSDPKNGITTAELLARLWTLTADR